MSPQRIQLRRRKGWRKPEGAIVVARPSRWGNPYQVVAPEIVVERGSDRSWWAPEGGARQLAVDLYRQLIVTGEAGDIRAHPGSRVRPSIAQIRSALAGHDLACWCKTTDPCHADVLLELCGEATDAEEA